MCFREPTDGDIYLEMEQRKRTVSADRVFDLGYLTVTPDHALYVSDKLKVDYDNGSTYYPLQGPLKNLPRDGGEQPSQEFLLWHNENVYRG